LRFREKGPCSYLGQHHLRQARRRRRGRARRRPRWLLSGGQRQRITIARAILRDAPVVILDEPTTGLDPGSARRVLGSLREATAGRTTILITHDLNLASAADDVMSLDRKAARRPAASESLPGIRAGRQRRRRG
jgi:ATP-binding cassette, subfamily B, bacterial